MSNTLNLDLREALVNDAAKIKDPGANGTINFPSNKAIAHVTLSSAGTNALSSAADHPLGSLLIVFAQAAVTVNSVTLADGEYAEFFITLDSSGDHQWVLRSIAQTAVDDNFIDSAEISFGTGEDAVIGWQIGDASNHTLVVGLGDSNQALHFTDKAAIGTDWNVSADTHPTLYVHSNETPASDYLLIGGHDGTTAGIDVVGGTTLDLRIAGTDVAVLDAGGFTFADNVGTSFGTGDDASILWDATNLVIDVDTGAVVLSVATTASLTVAAATATFAAGCYPVLPITDTDGTVEGSIWYDASEDKLKFKTAAGVETITST